MSRRIVITETQAGSRLDVALAELLGISRSQVGKQISAGQVTRGGELVSASMAVRAGDVLEVATSAPEAVAAVPDLKILYEDDDVLVIDKPAGLVVHRPESGREQPTVAAFAAAHGVVDDDPGRPGIVHRLDKDTSGAMVIAKNPAAKANLQQQFKQRSVGKTYVALVRGRLAQPEASIQLPIGRDRRQPVKRAVVPGARPAITGYHTLRTYPGATLVEIALQTGRTHQIRVHFAHIGHPVMGDVLYGEIRRPAGLSRQFLHAATLEFTTPVGKRVKISSPLPLDLQSFLDALGGTV